ncbi:Osmotically-inducible protein OsmY, contains BON domain [Formivibrio citricus]|uniref:Osmotically-inducible protein OsmY, contains BON domain n=1 Tax=Formivibrio citricus TaxID=83765 RepID=A0A1I4Z6I7_9NEIS|nr:BON domain-containing protein [Formivibrio citricus]SFN45623.1 Osmotically-inducible protein OsmY, contains BON domain [Formivibrio citricus]
MKKLIVALVTASFLSACVPLVFVGGAALGLWVGSDPRKPEVIKRDFDLGAQLSERIIDTYKERAHVNVSVFNDLVLLTGEVPDAAAKQQVEQFAWQMKHRPRNVYNELVVAAPSSVTARANDSQISARVKTAVLADAGDASAVHVMIVTERQVVYLMGIAKPALIERAAKAASKVSGVKQVVKLVEVEPAKPGQAN